MAALFCAWKEMEVVSNKGKSVNGLGKARCYSGRAAGPCFFLQVRSKKQKGEKKKKKRSDQAKFRLSQIQI